jgi:hypothetical protein
MFVSPWVRLGAGPIRAGSSMSASALGIGTVGVIRLVAQWGDTAATTPLASVRKSALNALIGNAVERAR